MKPATRLVQLEDVQLEVRLFGDPGQPAVVLLHGFPQTAVMWDDLATALAGAGYHVIAPNQRGYGQSGNPSDVSAYDIDRLTADVRDLARALGHDHYFIIGHDWGAAVGWWLATNPDHHLQGLVAISAPHPAIWRQAMRDDDEQKKKSRYIRFFRLPVLPELLIRLTRFAGLESAVANAGASSTAREAYRRSWRSKGNLTAMLNWYRALLRRAFAQPVRVTAPTLFIHGGADPYLSEAAARRTAAIRGPIERIKLDGGHWLVDETGPELRRLVFNFLERHK